MSSVPLQEAQTMKIGRTFGSPQDIRRWEKVERKGGAPRVQSPEGASIPAIGTGAHL